MKKVRRWLFKKQQFCIDYSAQCMGKRNPGNGRNAHKIMCRARFVCVFERTFLSNCRAKISTSAVLNVVGMYLVVLALLLYFQ